MKIMAKVFLGLSVGLFLWAIRFALFYSEYTKRGAILSLEHRLEYIIPAIGGVVALIIAIVFFIKADI